MYNVHLRTNIRIGVLCTVHCTVPTQYCRYRQVQKGRCGSKCCIIIRASCCCCSVHIPDPPLIPTLSSTVYSLRRRIQCSIFIVFLYCNVSGTLAHWHIRQLCNCSIYLQVVSTQAGIVQYIYGNLILGQKGSLNNLKFF